MRAGRLDRTITVLKRTEGEPEGPFGTIPITYPPLATVRAEIVQGSTEDFLRSYGEVTETAIIFRIRWLDNVTTSDRVSHEGESLTIREVKEIGRRRGLEIRCVGRAGD